jgi:uncharacterized membrane protein (DUF4010 family)
MVVYISGVLIGRGLYIEGIALAITSSLLLSLKKELHKFADERTEQEIKSAMEFAIIAFVIYPILPDRGLQYFFDINPRFIWTLVVAVSSIGMINYILIHKYGEKGFFLSGFLGGLVNSTAVVYDVVDKMKSVENGKKNSIGTVLLANSAMSLRNGLIAIIFMPSLIMLLGIPLTIIAIVSIILSYYYNSWSEDIDINIESPFNFKESIKFGLFFLLLVIISTVSQDIAGSSGVVFSTFIGGIISSGSSTTTAITLLSNGSITTQTATFSILGGTISSILTKVIIAAYVDKRIVKHLLALSIISISIGLLSALFIILY